MLLDTESFLFHNPSVDGNVQKTAEHNSDLVCHQIPGFGQLLFITKKLEGDV